MRIRNICVFFILFILGVTITMPGKTEGNSSIDKNGITNMIEGLLSKNSLKSADIGIYIASLRNPNSPIFSLHGDTPLVPASCMKLATSSAALDYLGPDYTYETKVYVKGTLSNTGVLHGDLILYGTGDPSISGRFPPHRTTAPLEQLAEQVYKSGIKRVDGNIIGDGTYFDEQELGKGWSNNYLYDWYAAKVTALALNDNCVDIKVTGGKKVGDPAIIELDPPNNYIQINNDVKTARRGTRPAVSFHREIGSKEIHLTGRLGVGLVTGPLWASVEDPIEYTAQVFKEVLGKKGVSVTGRAVALRQPQASQVSGDTKIIAKYISPPLRELLKPINKNSQNLYAELLLKTLGRVKYGEGSYANGIKAIRDFLETTGMDLTGYEQVDGCGLSPYNRITPHQLAGILEYMSQHKYHEELYNSLSIPGKDGSLKSRFHDLSHVMRGKTGGIKEARTLTAYLTTRSGEPLIFSIMSNDFRSRETVRVMDNTLVEKLAQY